MDPTSQRRTAGVDMSCRPACGQEWAGAIRERPEWTRACAVVMETERAVTVYWTSTRPEGIQRCPGNPVVKRILELRAPLADRPLLDGSTWPPGPVTGLRR